LERKAFISWTKGSVENMVLKLFHLMSLRKKTSTAVQPLFAVRPRAVKKCTQETHGKETAHGKGQRTAKKTCTAMVEDSTRQRALHDNERRQRTTKI
jgi:hypothetical protein